MPITHHLQRDAHVHRFSIVASDQHGWDAIEEEDAMVLVRTHREDWHRVERDIQRFEMAASELKRAGWVEQEITAVLP
jgi:hypothetical protein